MINGLTDHARIAVALAQHEAERLSVPFIGDDILLIGLAQAVSRPGMRGLWPWIKLLVSPSPSARANAHGCKMVRTVFTQSCLDVDHLSAAVELQTADQRQGQPRAVATGPLPFTADAKATLVVAGGQAQARAHLHCGAEHLLLGLLTNEHGAATKVIAACGVAPAALRAALLELMPMPPSQPTENPATPQLPPPAPSAYNR